MIHLLWLAWHIKAPKQYIVAVAIQPPGPIVALTSSGPETRKVVSEGGERGMLLLR